MSPMTLGEIARVTNGVCVGDADLVVTDVATDSRNITAGDVLFVALRGEHADGHAFVEDAMRRGAAAVLTEHPLNLGGPGGTAAGSHVVVRDCWWALAELARHVRASAELTAVAITGSVGKTTVKDLTAAALATSRRIHAAQGSHNNELGVPLTILRMPSDIDVLVSEIGARHVGDIARLAPIVAPDVAVVTAVAGVHLEVFGSIEAVAEAKTELVHSLGPDGVAVLNVADARVAAMAVHAPRVVTVALDDPSADVHAVDVRLDELARASATAVTPWGDVHLELGIAGRHHLINALLALAVAGEVGVPLRAAAEALANATVSPWRGELTRVDGVTIVNDAYNANPTSVIAALDTLAAIEAEGRRIAVLGEMAEIGADAYDEHVRVGRHCMMIGIDVVIVVGEAAIGIDDGVRSVGGRPHRAADAQQAARQLEELVSPGDVVLVKASRIAGLESVAAAIDASRPRRTP